MGAAILKEGWLSGSVAVSHKGRIDLVTQYDPMSEAAIVELIRRERPGEGVLAEEGGGEREGERVWCIDPLDGTTNFAHGLPFFTVSIALLLNGEPVVGVVNNPALGYEFYATRGGGAWFNGVPLATLENDRKLLKSIVAFGCGYDRHANPGRYLPMMERFMVNSQGLRRTGSASLDCCFVARGWFDAYVEVNLYPWDLAAGALIAAECGAVVTDVNGAPLDSFSGRIMVARPGVHGELQSLATQNGLFTGEFDGTWGHKK